MLLKELASGPQEIANQAIHIRCEHDFETFCEIFFSHYIQFSFNTFHRDCFDFYRTNQTAVRRVDCAPRGYAKSTVKGLFKPLHDICYGLQKYLLFISATKAQSIEKLKDIRAEILANDLLIDVYGVHFPTAKPGAESFEVFSPMGSVFLKTVSAGTEIRGLRYREARPSKIILDDAENTEEVDNEELREKTKKWFFEVVSNLGSNQTDIEIVGTILHRNSLLMTLNQNPAYTTNIYRAVLSWAERKDLWDKWRTIYTNLDNEERGEDAELFYMEHKEEMLKGTKVLWPEKEPYVHLMKEMVEKGKRAFMKEKQNQPLPSNDALFDNIWWYYETTKDGIEGVIIEKTGAFIPMRDLFAYGALDPATGDGKGKNKKRLDYSCIASGLKDMKGRLFVHKDFTKKVRPSRYIQEIFEHNELMNYEKFGVEINLYRTLLIENIVREKKSLEADRKKRGVKDWGIKVPFYEIDNRDKKEKRIYTLEPKVNNGWILFNRTLSIEFMDMIEQFPGGDHDDGPDALEMLWGMVNNRYKPSPMNLDVMGSR